MNINDFPDEIICHIIFFLDYTDVLEFAKVCQNFKRFITKDIITQRLPKIEIDYIYLDSEERQKFAQINHEYLIKI